VASCARLVDAPVNAGNEGCAIEIRVVLDRCVIRREQHIAGSMPVDPRARIHDDEVERGTFGGGHLQLKVRREAEAGRMAWPHERIEVVRVEIALGAQPGRVADCVGRTRRGHGAELERPAQAQALGLESDRQLCAPKRKWP
jgi:hypothetical protein